MKKICDEKGVHFLVPIIDVRTRWNSTYDMLVRACTLKEIISDTVYANKDNRLIKLLLDDSDWDCITLLIEILNPLKEVTLLASRSGENLTVVEVIPLYTFCTEMLTEQKGKINKEDDIYSGLECAVEKLNHYCDMVSPMVGIARILNPCMKKSFLRNSLCWEEEWVKSVDEHFSSSFDYYKRRVLNASALPITNSPSESNPGTSAFAKFLKRKADSLVTSEIESEYDRYIKTH
jgi:hypothetical protein